MDCTPLVEVRLSEQILRRQRHWYHHDFDCTRSMIPQVKLRLSPSVSQHSYQLLNVARISQSIYLPTPLTSLSTPLSPRSQVYVGISKHPLLKLQSVQNAAARFVTSSKFDHVTPLLKDLHWLPIAERIKFKLLLTFKSLHDLSLSCIKDLLTPYCPADMFRSFSSLYMVIRLSPYPPLRFGISYLMTLRSSRQSEA